jgi:hypothetical protein
MAAPASSAVTILHFGSRERIAFDPREPLTVVLDRYCTKYGLDVSPRVSPCRIGAGRRGGLAMPSFQTPPMQGTKFTLASLGGKGGSSPIDTGVPFQFSGVPNNATLELVPRPGGERGGKDGPVWCMASESSSPPPTPSFPLPHRDAAVARWQVREWTPARWR